MFEPVTMTRSASDGGGVGAAPMSVESGSRFCANAFDAIMREIPTQATRVMRRNPNLQSLVVVMISPWLRLNPTSGVGCARRKIGVYFLGNRKAVAGVKTICYNSETFCYNSEIFVKSPPTMRQLHFETTPAETKPNPRIRCDVAPPTRRIA